MTTGTVRLPLLRACILASCVVIWLKPGNTNRRTGFRRRAVAAQGEPDGCADDAGLRQRGVHYAVRAEFGNQAVGDR